MKDSSLWLFSLFLFVFSHTHSFAADVPAIVDGQFRVDEMGAATYSIPIHIAPGTAGVQPSVSLNYSSANTRDSHLGVGWSIGGMSMITRCPKTIATDGQTGAVSMATVSDKFCLDGQRLILKSGTYGQDNSFYYTETDNFMQIKARKGAAKAGIGYFIVYTRAGETMCYGNPVGDPQCTTNGPDAFIEPGGSSENSAAHFWALESVEDTTGNYFFYRYKEDRSAGTFYLSQINYTRNKHTNAPDYAYVKFNYDTRKTATRSWLAGGYRFDDRLLTSIESRVDGKLYRKYTMTYESPAQAEARVLLKTIRACDASNYCTPATRFDWQRPALVGPSTSLKPFKLDQSNKRMDAESYEGVRVMDINGDGYADAVWAEHGKWRIRLGPHWTSAINTNYPYGASDIVRNHALTIDADGDGRRDLLVANRNDANYVVIKYKAKHNATSAQCPPHSSRYSCSYRNVTTSLSAIALTGRIAHGYDDGEAHVADVDGDGLEDIVYRRGGKLFAYLNTSSTSKISFSEEVEVLSLPANASSYTYSGFMSDSYSTGSVVDINGDGRTDVIARITTRTVNNRGSVSTSTNWRLYMADGTADSPSMRQEMTFGNSTLDDMRATDLNGDGLTDIVYARGNNLYYRLSTGKRLSNEYALGYSVASHLRHKMQFIDLNYDGRADFMRPINNSRYQFYIAHPTNDIDTKPALNPVSFTYRGYRDYHGDAMYFGDKNGDGNMDMFVADGRYWDIYQDDNTPKQFAINRIENGFGVGTDIDYAPMTDDTVYFSDASTNDNSIDVFSPRYGMQLVHKVHTDINRDGAGKLQRVGVKYQYGGLLMHRKGRGVLGFEYLRTTDLQTNIVTETKYAQRWASNNFATSGMPIATIQYKGNAILSVAKNTLAQSNTLHGGNGKFGAFAYVSKSEEETHQIDTGAASSWHVSTTTTTNTYNDAGSLKKSTVVVDDRNSSLRQTTTTDNAYYDGYWPKLHARLKSTTVTKSRRAGSATPTTISRTSSFSYYRDKLDHDNAGMLKEERIGVGSDYDRSTTYEYDDYGNTVNVSTTGRVDTAGKHQTRRITSNFHKSGRFLHEKCVYYATSACHKTTYKYNHKKAADASGVIETITTIAPTGMQTHTTTTRLGTLTKVKSPDGSERVTHALFGTSSFIKNEKYYVNVDNKHGSTFLSPTKKTYFDAWGRETGTATRSMHHRWHITQRFYDEDGRLKKHHQPSMDGYHANHIAYTYDSLGRPSIVEHPNGLEEEYKYLRNGSKSKTVIEKRSNGQTHYHVEQRNGIGELVTAWQYGRNADADENEDINFGSSTNPSHYSEYEYDPYGNMTLAKTHAHGKATKTSTKYDSYGYKQWTDDTIKGRWEYEYNAFGELIEQTTARNHNTIFSYDSLGRQIRRYERNEGTACWIYNDTHKKGLLTEKRLFQGSNKTCNSSAT
ncbi:MAG: FG-GAP-like repeat-containing protein, partial [Pseudomonadota bacterium]